MPLKKFGDNDIFHNTVRTAPKNQFDIYGGNVYHQNESEVPGNLNSIRAYSYTQDFDSTPLGSLPVDWTTSGDFLWEVTSSAFYNGDRSAGVSSSFTGSSSGSLVYTASLAQPEVLTFQWKVSSEENFDFLRFYIDGALQDQISGLVGWQEKTYSLPAGSPVLKWEYLKDSSVSANDDSAWVDDIQIFKLTEFPYKGVPTGYVSLYELNIDRRDGVSDLIYPFLTKNGTLASFNTVSTTTFNSDFAYGDIITGSYPLSASISRDYVIGSIGREKINALKTAMNSYSYWSPHYQFSSSYGNRATQTINLISIPSIFYGSSINKENGSISLKYYVSGTLIGELQDVNRNGELIQVGPSGSNGSGSVAGIALYNEGFLLLTGSWPLETGVARNYLESPTTLMTSSWLFYGVGMNDASGTAIPYVNYRMDFEGVNYIETLTMLAHANKAELNHSNNPTYVQYQATSSEFDFNSAVFNETKRPIKNTVKSPYPDPTGSFEKVTYITKVGIYDDDHNLIGVATVSKPVKKTLDRDLTFKLKLDLQ